MLCARSCPYIGTCTPATHLAYFLLSPLCYGGCHRSQWFIILVFAHILGGRVLESASYIKGREYGEYFLIFIPKPRIYFSPNGGNCAKKDGLNEFIPLRPSLWIERVMPVCLSFLGHAFLSVQWHTCPANLWIWYIVYSTGMWTFRAFEDWVHYRFLAFSFYLSFPIFLSEKGRFMTPLTLILSHDLLPLSHNLL